MTSRDFCYWLQGYFEIGKAYRTNDSNQTVAMDLGHKEVEVIQRHLNMVFVHEIDPSFGDAKHQQLLNAIHEGKPHPPTDDPKPTHPHSNNVLVRC